MSDAAPTLPIDAEGAEAIRLAEHVLLGHCVDADGLAVFVAALPRAVATETATAPSLQRLRWALAQVQVQVQMGMEMEMQVRLQAQPGSDSPPAPPDAPRWRALQNVVLALAGPGRCGEAAALLAADEAVARAHGTGEAGVAYAADAVEHYFAQEALVRAHHAAGDAPAASAALQRMSALLLQISEADGLRDWCAETLADLQR